MKEVVDYNNLPKHIAIIIDGNRRWVREKGKDAKLGHKSGADNLDKLAHFANDIGLKYMTVYAFSTENWKRAEEEVGALMVILVNYLDYFRYKAETDNIKINILGDINRVDKKLQKKILDAVEKTKNNTGLILNIAFNYGGRNEIVYAMKNIAKLIENKTITIDDIDEKLISRNLYTKEQPDPDLVIRTGGELRISNFLPWQSVYSELYFTNKY